jgi:hypothetical protein
MSLDPYQWPPIPPASKIADSLGSEQWFGIIVGSMPHSVTSLNRTQATTSVAHRIHSGGLLSPNTSRCKTQLQEHELLQHLAQPSLQGFVPIAILGTLNMYYLNCYIVNIIMRESLSYFGHYSTLKKIDGTLYVSVRFKDKTDFSLRYACDMFVVGADICDMKTGDYEMIREYMRPIRDRNDGIARGLLSPERPEGEADQ